MQPLAAGIIAEKGLPWNEARSEILESNPHLSTSMLPSDEQIETALREHYAIFDPEGHKRASKETSVDGSNGRVKELEQYSPLLTKGVSQRVRKR